MDLNEQGKKSVGQANKKKNASQYCNGTGYEYFLKKYFEIWKFIFKILHFCLRPKKTFNISLVWQLLILVPQHTNTAKLMPDQKQTRPLWNQINSNKKIRLLADS